MILLNKSVAKLHFSIVANLWLNFHLQRYPEISYSCTMSCLKKSSMSATPGDEARWPDQKKLAYLPTYPPTSLPTYLPPKCIFSNVYFVKMYFSKVYFSKVYFFKVYFSKRYLSKVYFCKMYPTCVSSKLCEFIRPEAYPALQVYFTPA